MILQDFFNAHNGKYVEFNNDGHKNQCKDLFSFYNRDVVGNPKYVYGDAWQLYDSCPAAYYKKVSVPQKGDVAIWQKSFGGFGHVAIVWDGGRFFSQNYPLSTPCGLQTIPVTLLIGYLRPIIKQSMELGEIITRIFGQTPVNEGTRTIIVSEGVDAGKIGLLNRNGEIRVAQNDSGKFQALLAAISHGVTSEEWAKFIEKEPLQ